MIYYIQYYKLNSPYFIKNNNFEYINLYYIFFISIAMFFFIHLFLKIIVKK